MWVLFAGLILKYLLWFEIEAFWPPDMTKDAFMEWLSKVRKTHGIGLFAILMLGKSDQNAGELILDSDCRSDVADASAEDCWFIYFKSTQATEESETDLHKDHAKAVSSVAKWLELKMSEFPCIVFFEQPEEGQRFIYVPLEGLSKDGIVDVVQEIFDEVRRVKNEKTSNFSVFDTIARFQRLKELKAQVRNIVNSFSLVAMHFAAELINKNGSL